MRRKVQEKQQRNVFTRFIYASEDKADISHWKQELDSFLHVFNVRAMCFQLISCG